MTELEILKDIANRLSQNNIEYMISGSVAMNFYTIPRMTRDIDIIILITVDDIDRITSIFQDAYYIDREMVEEAILNNSMFNIIHFKEIIKIDFIIRKNEAYRIFEFNNRKKIKYEDIELSVVSIEDLIISKLYWAKDSLSEVQLNDIKNLMKCRFDLDYIRKWCNELQITSILTRILPHE